MSESPCDALVLFGATGDLAHKKILPSIYRLERRGRLEIPIVAVASSRWSLEELRKRVAESVGAAEGGGGEGTDALVEGAAALPDAGAAEVGSNLTGK